MVLFCKRTCPDIKLSRELYYYTYTYVLYVCIVYNKQHYIYIYICVNVSVILAPQPEAPVQKVISLVRSLNVDRTMQRHEPRHVLAHCVPEVTERAQIITENNTLWGCNRANLADFVTTTTTTSTNTTVSVRIWRAVNRIHLYHKLTISRYCCCDWLVVCHFCWSDLIVIFLMIHFLHLIISIMFSTTHFYPPIFCIQVLKLYLYMRDSFILHFFRFTLPGERE